MCSGSNYLQYRISFAFKSCFLSALFLSRYVTTQKSDAKSSAYWWMNSFHTDKITFCTDRGNEWQMSFDTFLLGCNRFEIITYPREKKQNNNKKKMWLYAISLSENWYTTIALHMFYMQSGLGILWLDMEINFLIKKIVIKIQSRREQSVRKQVMKGEYQDP